MTAPYVLHGLEWRMEHALASQLVAKPARLIPTPTIFPEHVQPRPVFAHQNHNQPWYARGFARPDPIGSFKWSMRNYVSGAWQAHAGAQRMRDKSGTSSPKRGPHHGGPLHPSLRILSVSRFEAPQQSYVLHDGHARSDPTEQEMRSGPLGERYSTELHSFMGPLSPV